MPTTRDFTLAELATLGVPPDSPADVEWSDIVLADTHVAVLKYTQQRRVVFLADDGMTYAVTYEAALDTGDYEVGGGLPDNHGWTGDTVTATRVVSWPTVTRQWQTYAPDIHDGRGQSVVQELADVYEDAGARALQARQLAVELLTKHATGLAQQQRAELCSQGYGEDCPCGGCSACLAREVIDLIDPAAGPEGMPPHRSETGAPYRPEDAAQVHYVDNRARRLAQAYWRLLTGGTRAEWLALGKDSPEAVIREGRDWLRAAVAAGLLPLIDTSTGAAITTVSLDLDPRHHA
ncbi:hypothetical protein ACFT0G_25355 [Streptomyces sp. NPDC057020]|uniref:hypothetical protein n=1 Tax=unclassified Streptomyces TaxID=2593676 RepID=UPI00363DAFD8